jgi:cerevisin
MTPRISGLNWVVRQAAITGRPSVASISIQGSADNMLDAAITNVRRKLGFR